jgi:hypothetical protein
MNTHLSTHEITSYVARTLTRGDFSRVSDHVYGCATCHQELLAELQKKFPIEIDLDELAGMEDWHLQGNELMAYVEKQMEELDLDCASLHLEECFVCRQEVERATRGQFVGARLRRASANQSGKSIQFIRRFPHSALMPARIAAVVASVIVVALVLWSALHPTPENANLAETPADNAPPVTAVPDRRAPYLPEGGRDDRLKPVTLKTGSDSNRTKQKAEEMLIARDLVMPESIERLDRTPVVAIRGDQTTVESFSIIEPSATLVRTRRPTFRWTPLAGAEFYIVSVYGEGLHIVQTSGPLIRTEWSACYPLKPGVIYTWIVTARRHETEIIAPTAPARAEFRLLAASEVKKLNREISNIKSKAARGVVLAAAGLLVDAEIEFNNHLSRRPNDERVWKLLRTTRLWRGMDQ